MGDLTPPPRAAVMTLLAAALSQDGSRKVIEIVRADEGLRNPGGRGQGGGPGGGPNTGAISAS